MTSQRNPPPANKRKDAGEAHYLKGVVYFSKTQYSRAIDSFQKAINNGYENASKEFTKKQIKADITERQANHDWQFVFIGAGIDAFAEAGGLGIKAYSTLGTASTPDGIKSGYYNLTNSTVNYANNTSSFMDMTVTTSVEEEEGKKKKVTSGASS